VLNAVLLSRRELEVKSERSKTLMNKINLNTSSSSDSGPGSSVGIATDYGLDGPGSNPGGDEIFRPFRSAMGPTQPPVQWVPGLFRV